MIGEQASTPVTEQLHDGLNADWNSLCLLEAVLDKSKCLVCHPFNSWYDEDKEKCSPRPGPDPESNPNDSCEVFFSNKICKQCKQQGSHIINEGHGIFKDMTRRGMCVNHKMGCPHQKGYFLFTNLVDRINPVLSQ
jgi:hypothetical protein